MRDVSKNVVRLILAAGMGMPTFADHDFVVGTEAPDFLNLDRDLTDGWHWT